MKKFLLTLFVIIIIILLIFLCFISRRSDVYNKHKKYRQTFGVIQYETLNHQLSDSDMKKSEPIFDKVESAIFYSGYKKDSNFEESLMSLCCFKDDYDYAENVSDVKLLTYKEMGSDGFLWIEYTQECLDDSGELVTGAYDVLCLIKTNKNDGNIIIEDVIEEP